MLQVAREFFQVRAGLETNQTILRESVRRVNGIAGLFAVPEGFVENGARFTGGPLPVRKIKAVHTQETTAIFDAAQAFV